MAELELALAASARTWSDRLHRFLVDHGGAQVRARVMSAEDALSERYGVLLIDDVCSFLTPRFVDKVKAAGRQVVGVFEARDAEDAKRRLLECGVDDVVEADAPPEEMLSVVRRVRDLASVVAPPIGPAPTNPAPAGRLIAVGAPPGGCGATEVAIALAGALGTVIADVDDVAPAVAQRLGLPLHPNLRTAIDVVLHGSGDLDDVLNRVGRHVVLAGLAGSHDWSEVRPEEVLAVIEELSRSHDPVVANIGGGLEPATFGPGRFTLGRAVLAAADVVVGVCAPHPVGVRRMLEWMAEARRLAPEAAPAVLVNQVTPSPYRRSEVERELRVALPAVPVHFLPFDRQVTEAAWKGSPTARGPFLRAVGRLTMELVS